MTIKELLYKYYSVLENKYQKEEITVIFYRLTEAFWQIKRIDLSLHPDLAVPDNRMEKALEELSQNKPWQYIAGETAFYGLPFRVNENVLIPRPETEELVDWIIGDVQSSQEKIQLIDIGTGSGAIAVSLAKYLKNTEVTALDISLKALEVAQQNADLNKVEINFVQADILQDLDVSKYDIIVSNPPYVREQEKAFMQKNVLDYEPDNALFVPDDNALLFYEKIIELAKKSGRKQQVYFEINEYLQPELEKHLHENQIKNYLFKKDFFGKWRMLKLQID